MTSRAAAAHARRARLPATPGTLVIPVGVTLQGAGRGRTVLRWTNATLEQPLVILSSASELRDLTVFATHVNASDTDTVIAVRAPQGGALLDRVDVEVFATATAVGIELSGYSSSVTDSSVRAYGLGTTHAVLVHGATLDLRRTQILVLGATPPKSIAAGDAVRLETGAQLVAREVDVDTGTNAAVSGIKGAAINLVMSESRVQALHGAIVLDPGATANVANTELSGTVSSNGTVHCFNNRTPTSTAYSCP